MTFLKKYSIILSLIFSFFIAPTVQQGYHKPCNETVTCDGLKGLTCQNQICECRDPQDMEWNEDQETCLVLIGGNCGPVADEPCDELEAFMEHLSCPKLPCLAGMCLDKVCVCASHNCENTDSIDRRQCLLDYGCGCDTTSDCDPSNHLQCRTGICLCPDSELLNHLDRNNFACRLNVGQPCEPGSNFTCNPKGVECSRDACKCKEGLIPDSKFHECKQGSYPQDCEFEFNFNTKDLMENMQIEVEYNCGNSSNLVCRDRKCVCRFAPQQEWDEAKGTCASKEGQFCSSHKVINGDVINCKTGFKCVENAPETVGNFGICTPEESSANASKLHFILYFVTLMMCLTRFG